MWDYVGDNYVQRLIQSKADGKLVALNPNDGCTSCNFEDPGMTEALIKSQVEAVRFFVLAFFLISIIRFVNLIFSFTMSR